MKRIGTNTPTQTEAGVPNVRDQLLIATEFPPLSIGKTTPVAEVSPTLGILGDEQNQSRPRGVHLIMASPRSCQWRLGWTCPARPAVRHLVRAGSPNTQDRSSFHFFEREPMKGWV